MVETEFEEQLIETELHFVSGLIKDMASGDLEGLDMWKSFHAEGRIRSEGVVFELEPQLTNRGRVLRHATPDPSNHEIDPRGTNARAAPTA